ncbi:Uncharacterised protein, partial [Metamycoplasma alkalescens]
MLLNKSLISTLANSSTIPAISFSFFKFKVNFARKLAIFLVSSPVASKSYFLLIVVNKKENSLLIYSWSLFNLLIVLLIKLFKFNCFLSIIFLNNCDQLLISPIFSFLIFNIPVTTELITSLLISW